MPQPPADDWTRPIPRQPRGDRGPSRGASNEQTQRIPRSSPRPRAEQTQRIPQDEYRRPAPASPSYDRGDGYDEHDPDWAYEQQDRGRYAADRPGGRDGSGGPPRGGPPRGGRGPARRRRRGYGVRRFFALLALLFVGYLVTMVVVATMVWGSINRIDARPEVADRPTGGAGANYLLVGTDSREELTDEQRSEFGTGQFEGSRADTVMLLHVPSSGSPTLVSLPRDSYVEIRDHGWNKLNASHSLGGAALLVDTVEQSSGLSIDGYLEIGFGGFVGVVDKVGGVEMCLDQAIQDEKAHIDLPAGCQELSGADALGYVRMRYSDPRGDLGRVERQREFLAALVNRMAAPSTVLVPWRLHDVGTATGGAIALGEDTTMLEAARMALAMRTVSQGNGTSVTVPIANADYPTNVGSTVLWDEQGAAELWSALREGRAVPAQE